MSSTGQYDDLLHRLGWLTLGGSVVVGACLSYAYFRLPSEVVGTGGAVVGSEWSLPHDAGDWNWSVFQNRDGSISADGGSLAKQLRLAGTFFGYGTETDVRKAVIDDLMGGQQHVVGENEQIAETGILVVRIYGDRVVLRPGSGEEQQLWLGFARPGSGVGSPGGEEGQSDTGSGEGSGVLGGAQIGEHRWVFKRQGLLDYYQELRDEPERLLQVFDSLKPVYDAEQRIEGYRVGIEGEQEFFDAVGMVEGDVVRTVNSMKMTSRHRAEYFIKEFVADRCNVFSIDIERGGSEMKLVYLVR